jgi:hemerythrin-like domain-containing protein
MMTIKGFMTEHHKACDEMLANVEQAVGAKNFDTAIMLFEEFRDEILKHFDMEETYLFPMFEEKHSMTGGGPVQVMTMEHEQVRGLFLKLEEALALKESDRFFSLSESLMILIQQHNMKEEQMLYTMIQNLFGHENDAIVEHLKQYGK